MVCRNLNGVSNEFPVLTTDIKEDFATAVPEYHKE